MANNLTYLPLDNIGINGLNTQSNPTSLSPSWLVKADNIAFKESGRITFRNGFVQQVMPTTAAIGSLAEHKLADDTYKVFAGVGSKIHTVDFTDAAGAFDDGFTTGSSTDDWQFISFNKQLFGFQDGSVPVNYNNTTWGLLNSDTPQGVTTFDPSCGMGYYGRLWVGGVTEEKDVFYYSDTLQGNQWQSGASGSIDLKTVWGTDEIVAIAPFYGKLVIFGNHNIVIYNGPTDPTTMELDEVIRGIGCVSRDSVQQVADDLFFLSPTGLRSLSRTTELDKMPLTDMSIPIKDNIIRDIKSSTPSSIKGVYVESEGLFVLSLIDIDTVYVFDMKQLTPAKTPRVTLWNFKRSSFNITSLLNSESQGFLVGQEGGSVAKYESYSDKELISATPALVYDDQIEYTGRFQTTWIDLGEGVTSALLKKLKAVIGGGANTSMSVKWDRDFGVDSTNALSTQLNPPGTDFLYNVAKYSCNNDIDGFDYTTGDMCVYEDDGFPIQLYVDIDYVTSAVEVATRNEGSHYYFCHPLASAPTNCESPASEYSGVKGLKEYNIPLSKSAKYVQFTFTAETGGSSTVLQDLTLLFKRGKIR